MLTWTCVRHERLPQQRGKGRECGARKQYFLVLKHAVREVLAQRRANTDENGEEDRGEDGE